MPKLTYCRKERPAEATIRLRPLALVAALTFSGLAVAAASAVPAGAAQAAPAVNTELTGVDSYCEGVPSAYASDCTDSVERFLPPGTSGADEDEAGPDDINISNNPHVVRSGNGIAKGPRRHHRLRRGTGLRAMPGRQAHQRPNRAEQAQPAERPQRADMARSPQDAQQVGAPTSAQETPGAPVQESQGAPAQDPQQSTGMMPVQDRQANGAAPVQETQQPAAQNAKPPIVRVQIRRVGGRHAHHHARHHFSPRYA